MAIKKHKVPAAPGTQQVKEVAKKANFANKGTIASKRLTDHKKRDQGIIARKKNSIGKVRGNR